MSRLKIAKRVSLKLDDFGGEMTRMLILMDKTVTITVDPLDVSNYIHNELFWEIKEMGW
jgi:hypothetical protein